MHLDFCDPDTTVPLSENKESSNVLEQILCGICGEAHEHSYCSLVQIKHHVPDSYVPPKAHASLPSNLSLEIMADNSVAIIAKSPIQRGTTFGPLIAEKTFTLNPSIGFPLKIFSREIEDLLETYFDTSDEHKCNWMVLVRAAKTVYQQNLMCYQEMTQLYYVVIKDIAEGEELKVWYAPYYAKLMKKAVLVEQTEIYVADNETDNERSEIEVNELLRKQQNINRDSWICKFCGKVVEQVTKFAMHMLEHYTVVIRKRCPICDNGFRSVKSFMCHMKMVHNAKPPKNSSTLSKLARTVSDSPPKSAKSQVVGGPLLNELFTESDLDNPNQMLSSDTTNLDLESDNFNNLLGDDSVNKDLDQFNFEIEDENTNRLLVCDICIKQFSKLYHLVLHLKSHTGKFICTKCEKVFARNENLKRHKCKVGSALRYKCKICKKVFVQNKHLIRHINVVHENKFKCKTCTNKYYSKREFRLHKCIGELDEQDECVCSECGKVFKRRAYLQQHMRQRHRDKLICEVCAQLFANNKTLQQHMLSHSKPTFACQNCGKMFHRKDLLKNHEVTHNKEMKTCPSCNKSVTPKTLSLHKSLHTSENKTKKCDHCGREFSRAYSLQKHIHKHLRNTCVICRKTFLNEKLLKEHALVHTKDHYACPVCNKALKLKSSISRHVKTFHADVDVSELLLSLKRPDGTLRNTKGNSENLKGAACMNEVDKLLGQGDNAMSDIEDLSLINGHNLESIVDNFESIIDNFCDENVGQKDSTIDFGDIDMDLETNFNLHQSLPLGTPTGSQEQPLTTTGTENQEVCLSMPDLTEDSEIALGDNAYMIDNRTIIDQKEPGNVLVYIL